MYEIPIATGNDKGANKRPHRGTHQSQLRILVLVGSANCDSTELRFEASVEEGDGNGDCSLPLHTPAINGQCVVTRVKPIEHTEPEEDGCGFGPWRPMWMRGFANKNVFLGVFCLASVLQGMYYTYFVSVLTTIEKLFQIQSKTTGIIMSATEVGQISAALVLTHYGGHGHRPRWIACGMLLFATASFLCTLPHFLFGKQMIDSLQMNVAHQTPVDTYLCGNLNDSTVSGLARTTPLFPGLTCEDGKIGKASTTTLVLGILFISLLLIGIGWTAVYTLGIPYIDDNIAKRDSPLYFGITIGVRILGPVFGFYLGSGCTKLYVNPFEDPGYTNEDPRWISAWWLGPFIVAGALLFVTAAMFSFPRKLRQEPTRVVNTTVSRSNGNAHALLTPSLTNEENADGNSNSVHMATKNTQEVVVDNMRPDIRSFPATMRRLLRNEILLLRTASTVLHILPMSGLFTFLPKYLENQFRKTATTASMVTGTGVLVMGVGIFASGMLMRVCKPNARFVAGWIAITALLHSLGMMSLMFVGCPISHFTGLEEGSKQTLHHTQIRELLNSSGLQFASSCNNITCECSDVFAPVCSEDGQMFYSACTAGCTNYTHDESDKITKYFDCDCLDPDMTLSRDNCPLECDNFIWYVCIFSFFAFIHSTSEVGSMLLTLRCVDPKDKAMALGLIWFAIGLFGNVPCAIIYGAVVDSACSIWEFTCGQQGACWFYDPSTFRTSFHGMSSAIMFLAFLVDAVVWYKARSIHFQDEEIPKNDEEIQPMNNENQSTV
uniref:Solute carrier organic anion transporter family member n=1 Tax=Strigamia maritima TaxID=126957 RepID=T1J381_STRMM